MKLICSLFVILFDLNMTFAFSKYRDDVLKIIEMKRNMSHLPPSLDQFFVNISAYMLNIHDIDERSSKFGFDIYMKQSWYDGRYSYGINESEIWDKNEVSLYPDEFMNKQLWMPNLIISYAQEQEFHQAYGTPAASLRIRSDGRMSYRYKSSVIMDCNMVYDDYPMDFHTCELRLRSFMFFNSEMRLQWSDWGMNINEKASEVHSYKRINWKERECRSWHGNYSCLSVIFEFQRDPTQYILLAYIPSVILVCMTYLVLWLPIDDLQLKLHLGSLTTICMSLLIVGCHYGSPMLGHAKAVGKWLAACFILQALTIVFSLIFSLICRRFSDRGSDGFEQLVEDDSESKRNPVSIHHVSKKKKIIIIISRIVYVLIFSIIITAHIIIINTVEIKEN